MKRHPGNWTWLDRIPEWVVLDTVKVNVVQGLVFNVFTLLQTIPLIHFAINRHKVSGHVPCLAPARGQGAKV